MAAPHAAARARAKIAASGTHQHIRKLLGWLGERERQLRTLEHRERLWSDAFVHNIHGLAISDGATLRYVAVNPAYARLLGFSAAELVDTTVQERYPPAERSRVRDAAIQADALGTASLETLQHHRDGTQIPVLLDLVSLRDGHGQVKYRFSTITDLRERQRTEAELRRREAQHLIDQRFRLLAESAPIGILLTDADGVITYANPAWLAMTGRSAEQALGQAAVDAVDLQDRERVRAARRAAAARDSLDVEFRYPADGAACWVQSQPSALREAGTERRFRLRARQRRCHRLAAGPRRASARTRRCAGAPPRAPAGLRARRAGRHLAQGAVREPGRAEGRARDAAHGHGRRRGGRRCSGTLLGQAEAAQERLRRVLFDLNPPASTSRLRRGHRRATRTRSARSGGVRIDLRTARRAACRAALRAQGHLRSGAARGARQRRAPRARHARQRRRHGRRRRHQPASATTAAASATRTGHKPGCFSAASRRLAAPRRGGTPGTLCARCCRRAHAGLRRARLRALRGQLGIRLARLPGKELAAARRPAQGTAPSLSVRCARTPAPCRRARRRPAPTLRRAARGGAVRAPERHAGPRRGPSGACPGGGAGMHEPPGHGAWQRRALAPSAA
ncbi:MAG: PAS domain S-box protein [Steroidobacteraceae bacterium]